MADALIFAIGSLIFAVTTVATLLVGYFRFADVEARHRRAEPAVVPVTTRRTPR